MRTLFQFMGTIFAAFFFFMAPITAADATDLTLSSNGKTDYNIVISETATALEKTAASELQSHLRQITEAEWPIISSTNASVETPLILVGDSPLARTLFPTVDFEQFAYDGIVIKTSGKYLLLAGHKQRGTLYAVNTFLEDTLGCRWWSSSESDIPKKTTLCVAPLDLAYAPKLIYREAYYKDAFEPVFATRMKCNGSGEPIPENYGGHHRFVYFVHSFYPLIPPEKYFEAHPEWFSEINGKRIHEYAQLCLTNDEMCNELTKNALEALRKNPDAKFISISQNDWANPCQCEQCKAITEREGSESGTLITFVNKVAEAIEREFPDVWVETLAYQYTRKPPKNVKPRKNVILRLCTIECSFVQPLAEGEHNKALRDDIKGWSKIAGQLFIWDYVTNFSSYLIPHPNYKVLPSNIRFFVDHGTIGLFEQGDSYSTVGDFVRLRNYVISHLMWDPSRDERQLVDEFLNGYYGEKAAPRLKEYFALLINKAESSGVYLGCFRDNTSDWLDLDTLNQAATLLNEATAQTEQAYGVESPQAFRLRREKLPIDLVWLKEYYTFRRLAKASGKPFFGPDDPVKACHDLFALSDKYNNTAYREYTHLHSMAEFKENMLMRFGMAAPKPGICDDLPDNCWLDFQEFEFNVTRHNNWAAIVADEKASNKRAVKMGGEHYEWATTQPLDNSINQLQSSQSQNDNKTSQVMYRVYAAVRCDATVTDGPAMTIGVYDWQEKKGLGQRTLNVSDIAGDDYKLVDLGDFPLNSHAYIWAAPPKRPNEVQAVYVDRFVVILP